MADHHQYALGFTCVAISTLFFGSNFVPVKRYETHDGMFFQWVMCCAIFIVGLIVQLILFAYPPLQDGHWQKDANGTEHWIINGTDSGRPNEFGVTFMPFATLGGVLWATGNTMSVPIINFVGLGLGPLIWNSANMVMGWANAKWGLWGEARDDIPHPNLNFVGVGLALLALCMYPFIKITNTNDSGSGSPRSSGSSSRAQVKSGSEGLIGGMGGGEALLEISSSSVDPLNTEPREPKQRSAASKKLIGCVMAVVAGILFGNAFTPSNYLKYHKEGPRVPADYIFSQFIGIFATSTFWFIMYCIYMRGSPLINPRLVLPAFISGAMWAVAQSAWFIANDALEQSVAFPFTTSGPGIVSALWGVFVFGEIRGCRNYIFLCIAVSLAVIGCTIIGLSTAPEAPAASNATNATAW